MVAGQRRVVAEELEFRVVDTIDARHEYKTIQRGLTEHAVANGLPARSDLNLFCYDGDQMIGAIVGTVVGPHFNIKYLWVDTAHRRQNLGTHLMMRMEKMARKAGCEIGFIDTMDYQTPGFYGRFGYQETARIKEFHPGHDRIFYKKKLK